MFKMMKSSHIGLHHPEFFLHWAAFELKVERKDKALSVLKAADDIPIMRGNEQIRAANECLLGDKPIHLDPLYKLNTTTTTTTTAVAADPPQPVEKLSRTFSASTAEVSDTLGASKLQTPTTLSLEEMLDEKLAKLRKIGLGPPKRKITEQLAVPAPPAKEPSEPFLPLQKENVPASVNNYVSNNNNNSLAGKEETGNSNMSLTMTEGLIEMTTGQRKDSQPDTLTLTAATIRPEEQILLAAASTAPVPANSAAASSSAPVKSRQVRINGKIYRVLQLIGRGGSSKVFRVINADGQIFALKKVNLKNLDEATVSGYANEIQLLRKFANNPHIIQLIDAEMNREGGYLYLLMEYGEVDLGKLLKTHSSGEGADRKIDENFIRFSWQQVSTTAE